jgi:hypothetical protein
MTRCPAFQACARRREILLGPLSHRALAETAELVRGSMKLLPARFEIVTATVDGTLGEVGVIYQACGFDYVGVMCHGGRALVRIGGTAISERQAYRLAGTRGAASMPARCHGAPAISPFAVAAPSAARIARRLPI